MNINQKINFSIRKGLTEDALLCPELMLYFVIDGSARIRIKDTDYQLGQEDCVIVNSGNLHNVSSTPETLIAIVSISAALFTETSNATTNLFLFQSNFSKNSAYFEMVRIIRRLIYTDIHSNNKTDCMKLSLLFELMNHLIEHYARDTKKNTAAQDNDDLRITQLMQYVNQNYKDNISLATVADELFVSKSTLSRLFKKHTGIYFADYVNQVRIRSAVQELLHTEKSITRIAVDNGFSNPSTFHRVFNNYYHISPSDFKKEQRKNLSDMENRDSILKDQLRRELQNSNYRMDDYKLIDAVKTTVDVKNGTPLNKVWNQAINMGSVYDLTRANMQKHTLYLAEHLGFTHIRMWNIFSKQLMITDGSENGYFNYENLDVVLDFLYQNKLYPFFDFGYRPTTALYSENKPVYFYDDCVSFRTKEHWRKALVSLMNHVITRYGIETVSKWRFELSRDPMHTDDVRCYQGNYSFDDAFTTFYNVIKRMLPDAILGGAMFIPDSDEATIINFLQQCKQNQTIPSFISCLLFPYDTSKPDHEARITYRRTMRENFEINTIKRLSSIVKEHLPECMIYVDECNNSLSNRNYLNDSCFRATYYTKVLSEISPYVDMVCPWMGSDWVSNYYDTKGILNGGSGLLTKDSIRKPVYYSLHFLNSLGETLLERGSNYIITSKKGRSYYVLCFNYKEYNSNYYMRDEQMDDPDDIFKMFQDVYPIEVNFTLEGLPDDTKYIIKKRTINPLEGSLLYKWKNFEYVEDLSANDVNYLKDCCIPSLSASTQITDRGRLPVQLTLQNQEISLLHIYQAM